MSVDSDVKELMEPPSSRRKGFRGEMKVDLVRGCGSASVKDMPK